MFGAFTYIAYTLTEVSGFTFGTVPWLLVLFGVGLVIGNRLGGRLADRSIDGTLLRSSPAIPVATIRSDPCGGTAISHPAGDVVGPESGQLPRAEHVRRRSS